MRLNAVRLAHRLPHAPSHPRSRAQQNSAAGSTRPAARSLTALTLTALTLTACTGGGPSDAVSGTQVLAKAAASTTIDLYGFSVAKAAFEAVLPAFANSPSGTGVAVNASYGASGDQSRKVAAGAAADVVSFSVEPDVTRLVDAGLVASSWNAGAYHGVPFGSVVVFLVRKGNPKGIHTWDDLLRPGIEVVTPNPFSSGSAKWNLLAPYAVKSEGGRKPAEGLAYLRSLITEHVKTQPTSGRIATESFVQGTGDVLLSYENEAIFTEKAGEAVEHILPPQTFRIDNPIAVLSEASHRTQAAALVDFLYTPDAQEVLAAAGFRVPDAIVMARHTASLPPPDKLWTITDLGGWKSIDKTLFAKGSGTIAQIYEAGTSGR